MPITPLQFNSLDQLQDAVEEAVDREDRREALRLSGFIRKELQQEGGMFTSLPNGAIALADMLVDLSYIRLGTISETQALALIKDHLPAAFTIPNFDFDAALLERLADYDRLPDRVAFEQQLLSVFQKHTAVLGDATITIGSRQVPGTIGNWLTDYENFPSKAQRDELDALNYLNKSANVRKLSEPERRILLAIIKVYDVLKADIYTWNSAPEPQTEAEAFKDYDLLDYLPDLERDEEDNVPPAKAPPSTSPAAAPVNPNKIVAPVPNHGFAPAPLATPKPERVTAPPAPYQEDPIRPHRVINRPDLPNTTSDAEQTQKEVLANIQAAKAQGLVSAKLPPVAPLPHPDVVPTKLDDLRKRIQP